jgi:membrane fusion protein (multidrug efflux system)
MSAALSLPAPDHEAPPKPSGNRAPRRSWWGPVLSAFVVLLALGAGWAIVEALGHRDKDALPEAATTREPATVMVTVEPVSFRPVQRTIEAVGTLYGFEEVTISARVEGCVRTLGFDVADRVKPGDLLLEVDPTDHELSVQQASRGLEVELARLGMQALPAAGVDLAGVPFVMQARTRMDNSQSHFERVRSLAAARANSAEELDNATSDYRAAQAEYANQMLQARAGLATIQMKQAALVIARQQLKDTRICVPAPTQPIPGVERGVAYAVTHRAVAEGTLVRPGTEICKLVILQTLKLRVAVPERHSAEIRLGQSVEVHTAAFARPFAGTVRRVNPSVDPMTRTFEVETQVPNASGELKPGSFAKAIILTGVDAEAATVPLAALVNFAGISKIFVAENGRAREIQVTPGIQTAEWLEISKPALPRGACVITSGQTVLAAGTPVAVRDASKGSAAAGVNRR